MNTQVFRTLPVRALYRLPELARALNISRHALRRFLDARGVPVSRTGRMLYVLLSDFREHLPDVWKSLLAAETLRAEGRERAAAAARKSRPSEELATVPKKNEKSYRRPPEFRRRPGMG
jgi:hypothetical protein